MRKHFVLLACSLAAVLAGCSKSETPQSSAETQQVTPAAPGPANQPNQPAIEACTLLTSEEIESVQGEALQDAKPSGKSGRFAVSQCFFLLPTFTDSISLRVVGRGNGPEAQEPKQSWEEMFHRAKAEGEKREEKEVPREKIAGLGDEAFWVGSGVLGGLYVLKGNTYIKISVGGPGDQATKIKKCTALAQMVLKRL